jgi:hypothetical protein
VAAGGPQDFEGIVVDHVVLGEFWGHCVAFVIIGIGDRPKSVNLDAYHIDQIKVQTRFFIVVLLYTCLLSLP